MHFINDEIEGDFDAMIERELRVIVSRFEALLERYARFHLEHGE